MHRRVNSRLTFSTRMIRQDCLRPQGTARLRLAHKGRQRCAGISPPPWMIVVPPDTECRLRHIAVGQTWIMESEPNSINTWEPFSYIAAGLERDLGLHKGD